MDDDDDDDDDVYVLLVMFKVLKTYFLLLHTDLLFYYKMSILNSFMNVDYRISLVRGAVVEMYHIILLYISSCLK